MFVKAIEMYEIEEPSRHLLERLIPLHIEMKKVFGINRYKVYITFCGAQGFYAYHPLGQTTYKVSISQKTWFTQQEAKQIIQYLVEKHHEAKGVKE